MRIKHARAHSNAPEADGWCDRVNVCDARGAHFTTSNEKTSARDASSFSPLLHSIWMLETDIANSISSRSTGTHTLAAELSVCNLMFHRHTRKSVKRSSPPPAESLISVAVIPSIICPVLNGPQVRIENQRRSVDCHLATLGRRFEMEILTWMC